MDGLEGVTTRIAELRRHLATLVPAPAAATARGSDPSGGSGPLGTAARTAPAQADGDATAFASALAQATSAARASGTAGSTPRLPPGSTVPSPAGSVPVPTLPAALLRPAALGGPAAGAPSTTPVFPGWVPPPTVAAPAVPASGIPAPAVPGTVPATTAALTASGVPADLAAYGNGRVPASALRSIGRGDHRLWHPAADSFVRMAAAAARDGVAFGVNDSYRSYAEQVDVAARKGLYSQGGLAARPGTSDHGWGRSVDLQLDGEAQAWLRSHAAEYGWENDVRGEPWHWTYTPR